MKKRNVLFCAVLALAGICQGAGFTILEQSANGMGRALAGMAADTEDPSALYFNPATPAWSETAKISLGTHFLYVGTGYEDHGSDPIAGHHAGATSRTSTMCSPSPRTSASALASRRPLVPAWTTAPTGLDAIPASRRKSP